MVQGTLPAPPGLFETSLDALCTNTHTAPRLLPLVYEELRLLARRYLRRERYDHTLEPTALVHEAYLRLTAGEDRTWENRVHFFRATAQTMRRILVDHARRRECVRHGGGMDREAMPDELAPPLPRNDHVLALDEALTRLAALDERQSRIVELRFFGGLTVEQIAQLLEISPKTVKREWAMARGWLHQEITP